MSGPEGYPSRAHLRDARRVRVRVDRVGAFTRGNLYNTNTARTTVLAADLPTSWSGRCDYWPAGCPAPWWDAPVTNNSAPQGVTVTARPAPIRSTVYRRAERVGLDMDTLTAGQLRTVLTATVERVGADKWRAMGADARERALSVTVNAH